MEYHRNGRPDGNVITLVVHGIIGSEESDFPRPLTPNIEDKSMQSYYQHNPGWAELLHNAVTELGVISKAFSRFHRYSFGNQALAFLQMERRGIEPDYLPRFHAGKI